MNTPRNIMRISKLQRILALILAGSVLLDGCATSSKAEEKTITPSKADPYERINRKVYVFNDTVDSYVAEPIANAYKAITPQFVQTGVFNFYNNLKNINIVVNDLLQAKFKQSAEDTGRFAINSTVGVLGLIDVAKRAGLEQNEEDFDQTLAVWGVPQGPYLVIPFLGPVTARGVPGAIFDTAANPTSYVGAPVQLVSLLNTRANAEGALKFIDEAALDPYVFTRESFLQWRTSLATDGKAEASSEFDEELDIDDGTDSVSGKETKPGATTYTLKFGQASQSFSSAAQAFDNTAKSFEEATTKAEQLKAKSQNK